MKTLQKQKDVMMKNEIFLVLLVMFPLSNNALVIDRAIVASDANPDYLDFWPLIAKAWNKLNIKPTLALIANQDVIVDKTVGDVIRFEPIPGISNGLYAQTIRLLLPILFENEVCLISDIDMIPINPTYFQKSIQTIPDHMFVVYRDAAYSPSLHQYPMCYNAAKGSTFKEIFKIKTAEEIPALIYAWSQKNLGWSTDERILYSYLNQWKDYTTRCIKLSHTVTRRIDRSDWKYDIALLKNDYYIDCHSIRPYKKYKGEIDILLQLLNIN